MTPSSDPDTPDGTPAPWPIPSVVDLSQLYGQLGQRRETLALLEEGFRQHSPLLLDIQNDCSFDFVHNDQRYRSLIKKIGLRQPGKPSRPARSKAAKYDTACHIWSVAGIPPQRVDLDCGHSER